jgi:hypothetical protein
LTEVLINILGTVLGGLTLTFILLLLNEHIFKKINVTGEWKTTVKVKKTSFKPFQGLSIEYKIHLIQKGNDLSGSGEKVKDTKINGEETIFHREKRVLIDIEGSLERNFLKKSLVYLNINEHGRNRKTRATYSLAVKNTDFLLGTFISTAGDSYGVIEMKRVNI